ncbi:MAG: hypothetical protein IGS48_10045 [Oscillatoriales cyanobacterium C42_A2020_001]|nr:hypothetical protein [Leptolyngbyaceae cyanobacterium C42_A2020_001]
MNSLCRLLKAAPLVLATVFGSVYGPSFAQGCPRSEYKSPEATTLQNPSGSSQANTVRPNADQKTSDSTIAAGVDQLRTIAAIAVTLLAGGSLAALAYKLRLANHKFNREFSGLHPELEHPELLLTDLPKEALPEHIYLVDDSVIGKREAILTR